MSKPLDFWETHDCRSLEDIQDYAMPLLEVELKNVVVDELHLMLRITGNHYNIYIYIYIYIYPSNIQYYI